MPEAANGLELPEFLRDAFQLDPQLTVTLVVIRLALGLGLGCVVAGVYRATRRSVAGDAVSLVPTLVLLTVIITMVTLAIGNNVARAFSLVGALAIVRFRTVVEDTRDTAFVIFAVAVGMAVGAGLVLVPLVGIPFTAVAAFLFRPRGDYPLGAAPAFTLTVRIGVGQSAEAILREPLAQHCVSSSLAAMTSARQGAAFDVTYAVRLRHPTEPTALVSTLNGIEGVQSVELRRG